MAHKDPALPLRQSVFILLPIALIFALFFLANPSIISDLRSYSFDDGTYSHAYLIPFVILYLYWNAAKQHELIPRWNTLFFILFLGSLLCFLLLQLAQQNILSRLLLPLVVIFALLSLFRVSTSVIVPASLLWFITPIWMAINGLLQKISVVAVTEIMKWTNVPTFVEGNFVYIPAGTFEIADGCSGLRYFIVSLALSVIFSFLNLKRVRSIVLFFTVAIIGSMITNWIRIALLILIGDYTDMQSSLMDDHNTFGWYLYVPFIALLFYFGSFLDRDTSQNSEAASENSDTAPEKAASQVTVSALKWPHYLLVLLPLAVFSTLTTNIISQTTPRYPIHAIVVESKPQSADFTGISPRIFQSDQYVHQQRMVGQHRVFAQHYHFSGTDDSRRSNYYLNQVVPDGWRTQRQRNEHDGAWLWVQSASGQPGLIYYWHQVGPHRVVSGMNIRLKRLQQALLLNQQTELYWYFIYCDTADCEPEQKAVLQLVSSPEMAR
ncbi:exosortase [Alkalimonas collagenimarina]|uniref:Exosortase n=1 Tax=Alkalimonas collagenimarina TaxID=400390 RepID=A0ABT9GZ81_9GAMM|nr:exosortase [Alkalimonas collagenimarina]MDP4536351.1 exosortase [Alkalimonas collagenimarina]